MDGFTSENVQKKYEELHNFKLFRNETRKYQTENIKFGVGQAKEDSIIITVDFDDWLPHQNVLDILNEYYDENTWLTYGTYSEYHGQNRYVPARTDVYHRYPGGSVVVSRDLMVEVGGYDPHIIEGYGPEDSMFWLKLELATLNPVGTGFDNVHLGGGQYSDIVQSQVLHFNHEHGIIDIDNAFIPFAYFVFLRYGDPKERKQFIESLKGLL